MSDLLESIRLNLRRIRSIAPAASDLLDSVESQISMMDAARGDAESAAQTANRKLDETIRNHEQALKRTQRPE